jgi:hypothetical protein
MSLEPVIPFFFQLSQHEFFDGTVGVLNPSHALILGTEQVCKRLHCEWRILLESVIQQRIGAPVMLNCILDQARAVSTVQSTRPFFSSNTQLYRQCYIPDSD